MMKNQRGFTLIEMMIVLLVVSILLMITVPNVTKHNSTINEKGCEGYLNLVEGQVQAYKMEKYEFPSIGELVEEGYIPNTKCPLGKEVTISDKGVVSLGK